MGIESFELIFFKGPDGADIPFKVPDTVIPIDEWDKFTCIRKPDNMEATFERTVKPWQMIKFIFKTCGFWFGVRFLVRRLFNQAKSSVSRLFKKKGTEND